MKVESGEIVQKTDVGGVLKIFSPQKAADAFEEIVGSVRSYRPDAKITGVLVLEMTKPGIEMMLDTPSSQSLGLSCLWSGRYLDGSAQHAHAALHRGASKFIAPERSNDGSELYRRPTRL
ncbi:acetate--CoA ligase family protein [Bradyrhizobium canariense]|uniref:acetate--CoA ligase family protein n=1 Tax=Bradyrhizobium canariense TaxID=255045 RepID=UPI003908A142